jgi:uncharacterized membrane protein
MDKALFGFVGIRELFNTHPMFVHFPLALIPTTLLFYFLGIVLKRPPLNAAGRACLYVALAGTLLAVYTGLHAMESFPHNDIIHHMAQTHKQIAFWTLGLLALLSLWSFWRTERGPRGALAFLAVLGFVTYLVAQAGDIGARMVYVQGAAVKPAIAVVASPDEIKEFNEPGSHHNDD